MKKVMKVLFPIWLVLLVPWLFLAPLSLMALGDTPPTSQTYVTVYAIWTYPVAVGIAAIFRKKVPVISLLPGLNIVACFVAAL